MTETNRPQWPLWLGTFLITLGAFDTWLAVQGSGNPFTLWIGGLLIGQGAVHLVQFVAKGTARS